MNLHEYMLSAFFGLGKSAVNARFAAALANLFRQFQYTKIASICNDKDQSLKWSSTTNGPATRLTIRFKVHQ